MRLLLNEKHPPQKEKTSMESIKNTLKQQSKHFCRLWCHEQCYEIEEFVHWLLIPSLNLLLTFRHQECIDIQQLTSMKSQDMRVKRKGTKEMKLIA